MVGKNKKPKAGLTLFHGFMKDYQEAKEDIRTGKTVSFKAIRRDV